MNQIITVISMLHEPAEVHSATRRFREKPVLQWTLQRLTRTATVEPITILCWDDQQAAVQLATAERRSAMLSIGPRQPNPTVDAIAAARRWADGWRGGLLGTCEFDLGFHAESVQQLAALHDADAVLLVDPAAALVDPVLIERLIEHAENEPSAELCFSQAAPGLGATLLRRSLVDRLSVARIHPGRLLTYWPDHHGVDPVGKNGCAPVPTPVARSVHRFKIDSRRQQARTDFATVRLNGHLISTEAEDLALRMRGTEAIDPLPRDVVLEINTSRASTPIFWPGRNLQIHRPDLTLETARQLFGELSQLDDIRLTLGGVGDPLLADDFFNILQAAKDAGISGINVETDLLTDTALLHRLASSGVDVISVYFPAATAPIYQQVMGVNGFGDVMENIRQLELAVAQAGRGLPLIAPTFAKTRINLGEMDAWYDYWIRRVGHAVITSPTDYAGQMADTAATDMAPPKRRPCARLASRITILCDGRVVSCEQDTLGKQTLGRVGETPMQELWKSKMGALRMCHAQSKWNEQPLCAGCREWHRP